MEVGGLHRPFRDERPFADIKVADQPGSVNERAKRLSDAQTRRGRSPGESTSEPVLVDEKRDPTIQR
jgi:hypothetical protein